VLAHGLLIGHVREPDVEVLIEADHVAEVGRGARDRELRAVEGELLILEPLPGPVRGPAPEQQHRHPVRGGVDAERLKVHHPRDGHRSGEGRPVGFQPVADRSRCGLAELRGQLVGRQRRGAELDPRRHQVQRHRHRQQAVVARDDQRVG
jgi:hypothetical protein